MGKRKYLKFKNELMLVTVETWLEKGKKIMGMRFQINVSGKGNDGNKKGIFDIFLNGRKNEKI